MHVVPTLLKWRWHVWVFSSGLKIVHRLSQPVSGPSTSLSDSDLSLCRARARALSLSPSLSPSLSSRGSLARQDMAILWRIFANIALFFYLVASMRASKWCACVSFFPVSVFTCAHMSAYVDVCVTYFVYTAIYMQNSIGRWWIRVCIFFYVSYIHLRLFIQLRTHMRTCTHIHAHAHIIIQRSSDRQRIYDATSRGTACPSRKLVCHNPLPLRLAAQPLGVCAFPRYTLSYACI